MSTEEKYLMQLAFIVFQKDLLWNCRWSLNNKAMLHYFLKNKQLLFEVFTNTFIQIAPQIDFNSDETVLRR
jgi:hypothetical protein